jgi:hypothetical protein
LAQGGHFSLHRECLPLGVKRIPHNHLGMFASDPKVDIEGVMLSSYRTQLPQSRRVTARTKAQKGFSS